MNNLQSEIVICRGRKLLHYASFSEAVLDSLFLSWRSAAKDAKTQKAIRGPDRAKVRDVKLGSPPKLADHLTRVTTDFQTELQQ
jgi:hypothetical protein